MSHHEGCPWYSLWSNVHHVRLHQWQCLGEWLLQRNRRCHLQFAINAWQTIGVLTQIGCWQTILVETGIGWYWFWVKEWACLSPVHLLVVFIGVAWIGHHHWHVCCREIYNGKNLGSFITGNGGLFLWGTTSPAMFLLLPWCSITIVIFWPDKNNIHFDGSKREEYGNTIVSSVVDSNITLGFVSVNGTHCKVIISNGNI